MTLPSCLARGDHLAQSVGDCALAASDALASAAAMIAIACRRVISLIVSHPCCYVAA